MKKVLIGIVIVVSVALFVVTAYPSILDNLRVGVAHRTEIPAHYITYTDEAQFFSISYPPEWEAALHLIPEAESDIEWLLEHHGWDVSHEGGVTVFFAGVPVGIGHEPNVNVRVQRITTGTVILEDYVEAGISMAQGFIPDYRVLSKVKTSVDGRKAIIVEWEGTFPGIGRQHGLVMTALVDGVVWTVACTPPKGEFGVWESDFHHIVRSLRILK